METLSIFSTLQKSNVDNTILGNSTRQSMAPNETSILGRNPRQSKKKKSKDAEEAPRGLDIKEVPIGSLDVKSVSIGGLLCTIISFE